MTLKDTNLLETNALIGGEWIGKSSKKRVEVINPSDHSVIATIPHLTEESIKSAISNSRDTFRTWKNTNPTQIRSILKSWHLLILENIDDLATILVSEQGKPLKEAKGEIKYAASYIEYYAEESIRVYGETIPSPFENNKIIVKKEPVGVVGIITPWNFPIAMMARKIAPALAVGCTCVVKPDERTPLSALAFIKLALKAGVPDGVINVVTGDPKKIGELLCTSPLVSKISFTGSAEVGKLLMKNSASTLKRLSLELGGNAPFIVFEDADLDKAIDGLMAAKFRNGGQTCVCANRIFVHQSIRESFIDRLLSRVKGLTLGNGLDDCDIGPMIDQKAIQKVEKLVKNALGNGGVLRTGGKVKTGTTNFYEPTVIDKVDDTMDIYHSEIFGPVVSLISFSTDDEVIQMANDTPYGLASYFYTADMDRTFRISDALDYGMIGVNRGGISSALIPFGGVKESGFGREGSRHGINEYISLKYISIG